MLQCSNGLNKENAIRTPSAAKNKSLRTRISIVFMVLRFRVANPILQLLRVCDLDHIVGTALAIGEWHCRVGVCLVLGAFSYKATKGRNAARRKLRQRLPALPRASWSSYPSFSITNATPARLISTGLSCRRKVSIGANLRTCSQRL